ncbi:hypothetical protein CYY_007220 [Polysphondylium violaceum]|uniref:Methylmalonyl-CoA epimerase, mitochondrial n=1 Tax=Polysphondylium violaceum TaxID=133409 RepID=A0A8J4PQS2_9MYCE|nr:hypothetical protein CYY_007220 [Polysphondylium violaceum]
MFGRVLKLTPIINNTRYYSTSGTVKNILGKVGIGRLNHVAIATPNLKESCDLWRDVMGADVSEPADQKEHGVTTVFVGLENTKIELLHPLGENSPIANFLKKNPSGGIHHICIEVDDIHHAVKTLLDENIRIIDPNPKIGAHGKPVVFLHPKSMNGVLVELEQK